MSYILPADDAHSPMRHYERLVRLPEFEHLRDGEAHVEFLFRNHPVIRGGRVVLGSVHLPTVQGQLKDVFTWMLEDKFGTLPDYLVVLDWDYWAESDGRNREILVYHELCHTVHAVDKEGSPRFTEEGRPVFALVGHDVEEFSAVVQRYGAHSTDLVKFMAAMDEHTAGGR